MSQRTRLGGGFVTGGLAGLTILTLCACGASVLWTGTAGAQTTDVAEAPATAPVVAPATTPAPVVSRLKIAKLTPPPDPYITDAQLEKAIESAADWLFKEFEANGKLKNLNLESKEGAGADFLAVYALLQAGKSIDDEKLAKRYDAGGDAMKPLVAAMKGISPNPAGATYARGIRLTAIALMNRKEDLPTLTEDVEWLEDACVGGGFTYDIHDRAGKRRDRPWLKDKPLGDNSNSQYGLLGLWSAADLNVEIPDELWQAVEKRWTEGQCPDGQWNYGNRPEPGADWGVEPRLPMTLAGLASLFVCQDNLVIAKFGDNVAREPFTPALEKGLKWLETGDNSVPKEKDMYTTYGLERVGLASGFKYFGKHDWFKEIATEIVKWQQPSGQIVANPGGTVGHAFCLLFLARGRHALLMNKVRFDHYWANRPHDVNRLARFALHETETVFNYQVVTLQHEWWDLLDAPILYIASHETPKFSDADYAKIRSYVLAGGLLFTQQDGNRNAFTDYVHKTMLKRLFPDFEMGKLPPTHEMYSLHEQLTGRTAPQLEGVSNGSRLLWVHSPRDLSAAWEQNAQKSKTDDFRTGLNMFLYAAGKGNFRKRVETSYIPAPPAAAPDNTVTVARVKYPLVTWDPEPYAWQQFANCLGWATSVGVKTQAVEMKDLGSVSPADVPLAHLTGSNPFKPTPEQLQSLAAYVEKGGVLLVDSCGGNPFNDSVDGLIAKAFPNAARKRIDPTHPLRRPTLPGMVDIPKFELRPYAQKRLGRTGGSLYGFKFGKGQVVCTTMDLTTSLLASRTWSICGFDAATAQQIVQNLVIWAANGAPGAAEQ